MKRLARHSEDYFLTTGMSCNMDKIFRFLGHLIVLFISDLAIAEQITCAVDKTDNKIARSAFKKSAVPLLSVDYLARHLYRAENHDNNSIFGYMAEKKHCLNQLPARLIEKREELDIALRKCLFIRKGAYGEAITQEYQDFLVDVFEKTLFDHFFIGVVEKKNLYDEIIQSGCLLKVRPLGKDGLTLYLQGYSFD